MENRILIIGDELFGAQGEAAYRFAEILLCKKANRPIQFSINAPLVQTLQQLYLRASSDVFGKRAGRIIMGLGLKELKRSSVDYAKVFSVYCNFIDEILSNTTVPLYFLTIPEQMFSIARSQLNAFNECVRELQNKSNRVHIIDFAACALDFEQKQLERGKFGRSLYTENGMPTSICNMLLALFLYDCIVNEIK